MTNSTKVDKCLFYKNDVFGKNVRYNLKKVPTSQGFTWSRVVALENMTDNMLEIITSFTEKEDELDDGKVMLIDATNRTVTNDYVDNKYEPSGTILLSVIVMDREYGGIITWNRSHHDIMRKHKKKTISSESKHYGSTDYYHSYENKGNFGIVKSSSVSHYVDKNCTKISHYQGKCIEELSQMEI